MYWMSSPYEDELGDWFSFEDVQTRPEFAPHKAFFEDISELTEIEMDKAFKKKAIQNIFSNPKKYLMNLIANIGRLFFSYPYSHTPQKTSTYFYLLPNMFIIVLLCISGILELLYRIPVPYEIGAQVVFGVISLGATSLVSAYARQFTPLVPIFLFWILWFFPLVIKLKKEADYVSS